MQISLVMGTDLSYCSLIPKQNLLLQQRRFRLLYKTGPLGALYIECQYRILRSDSKRTRRPLNKRDTTVTTDRETTADRNFKIMQMSYQHLFDTTKLQIVSNRIEASEDNTLYPFETVLQA